MRFALSIAQLMEGNGRNRCLKGKREKHQCGRAAGGASSGNKSTTKGMTIMVEKLKAKVLLVDDEEDFLATLAERLESRGLKVNTVTRGEDAVATVEGQNFDLIILDLAMPGIDGLETLKRIKARQPDAEIIMLSGKGSVKTSTEAMKLGAEDFMEKPVNITELMDKISEAKEKRMLVLQSKSAKEIEKILHSKGW
jgi:DNA-binding NtrC family response regulator